MDKDIMNPNNPNGDKEENHCSQKTEGWVI